jgi:hypothetical protein
MKVIFGIVTSQIIKRVIEQVYFAVGNIATDMNP